MRAIDAHWAFRGAYPRWDANTGQLVLGRCARAALRVCSKYTDQELAVLEHPVAGLALRGEELLLGHERGTLRATKDGQVAPITAWRQVRLHTPVQRRR